jgi:hypothetical protein
MARHKAGHDELGVQCRSNEASTTLLRLDPLDAGRQVEPLVTPGIPVQFRGRRKIRLVEATHRYTHNPRQRVESPATFTVESGKKAEYENALPLPRWQSRHEQA